MPRSILKGLVWHGYDDIKQGTADEYESNLQCFLRDIQHALELPWLPILIAELGGRGTGDNVTQEELDLRNMSGGQHAGIQRNHAVLLRTASTVSTMVWPFLDDYRITNGHVCIHR
jgi:hypothetical protein